MKNIDKLYSEMTWFHFYHVSVTKTKALKKKIYKNKRNNNESKKKSGLVPCLRRIQRCRRKI